MRHWLPILTVVLVTCTGADSDDSGAGDVDRDSGGPSDTASPSDDTTRPTDPSSNADSRLVADSSDDGGDDDAGSSSETVDCDRPESDWLFCEDFEDGGGDWKSWFDQSDFLTADGGDDRGRIRLSNKHATSGNWSVYMPAEPSSDEQGADLTWYACDGNQEVNCDLKGYDQLYFRTRVRFAQDHNYAHHFLNIRGLDRFWSYGKAGCLPDGESAMGTTVDFRENSHNTFFYTYHLDMSCDTNCDRYLDVDKWCKQCKQKGFPTCTNQKQCCWGDNFAPDPPVSLPVGEWFCFEMMMKANTPGKSDGKMAYWVDGKPGHSVDQMRWRETKSLKLNQVRLQHYIAPDDADAPNRVWFDDVVVSTERIGCPTGK